MFGSKDSNHLTCTRRLSWRSRAIEAVAAVAHDLASLADVAELLGEFEQARLGADDVSTIPRQTILPAASITQTAVRLPPTSSPANIVTDFMRASGSLGFVILGLFARTLENEDDAFLQVSVRGHRSRLR